MFFTKFQRVKCVLDNFIVALPGCIKKLGYGISTEPCFLQGGNERFPQGMPSSTNYIAKHSSNISSSSQTISSSIHGLNTEPAKEMPSKGMSLRPRLALNTFSKLQFFYFESIKVLFYNPCWFSLKELFFLMCTHLLYFFSFSFLSFSAEIYHYPFLFLLLSEKQRIDSGYYVPLLSWIEKEKEKNLRKDEKVYSKLGAMFAVHRDLGTTNSSSDSDVDVNIHHEK